MQEFLEFQYDDEDFEDIGDDYEDEFEDEDYVDGLDEEEEEYW